VRFPTRVYSPISVNNVTKLLYKYCDLYSLRTLIITK